jgi:hypothetical protein
MAMSKPRMLPLASPMAVKWSTPLLIVGCIAAWERFLLTAMHAGMERFSTKVWSKSVS